MRHRSVQSRAGSLTAAAVLALGLGASAAQASFVLDLKLAGGGTSTTVTAGATGAAADVNIDVWGTVTSSAAGATGIQDAFFGIQNSGGVGTIQGVTTPTGTVGVALQSPFTGVATDVTGVTTSYGGTLYGAPFQSVGATGTNASASADGWVFARSTTMTPTTNGQAMKLGTLTFHYNGTAAAGASTTLSLVGRAASSLVVPAVWQEGGQEADGTPGIGSSVTINVQSAVVSIPGDADGDGDVDLDDIGFWSQNYTGALAAGVGTKTRAQGDFDGDGDADLDDAGIWSTHYTGAILHEGNLAYAASLVAVPEPTSLGLLGLGAAALFGRRRRQA